MQAITSSSSLAEEIAEIFPKDWNFSFEIFSQEDLKQECSIAEQATANFLAELGLQGKHIKKIVYGLQPGTFSQLVCPDSPLEHKILFTNFSMVSFIIDDLIIEKTDDMQLVLPFVQVLLSKDVRCEGVVPEFKALLKGLQLCAEEFFEKTRSNDFMMKRVAHSMEDFMRVGVQCNSLRSEELTFQDALQKRCIESGAHALMSLNETLLLDQFPELPELLLTKLYRDMQQSFAEILSFQNDIASFKNDNSEEGSLNLVRQVQLDGSFDGDASAAIGLIKDKCCASIREFDDKARIFQDSVDARQQEIAQKLSNRMRWILSGIAIWSTVIPRYKN
jgi:hypothetical protein